MKFMILMILSVAIIFPLTGCTTSRDLTKQQQTYLLELPAPDRVAQTIPGAIKIRYCRAAAGFETQLFLYRTKAGLYQQDYYKQFISSPNERISDLLESWMSDAKLFQSVFPASSAAESEYTLEPHLLAIYTDLTSAETPTAVLKMHFVLLKYDPACRCSVALLEKTYERRQTVQKTADAGIIVGFNDNLKDICMQLIQDITDKMKK